MAAKRPSLTTLSSKLPKFSKPKLPKFSKPKMTSQGRSKNTNLARTSSNVNKKKKYQGQGK